MRKLNNLPLMLVLAVAFTACGKNKDASTNNNGTSTTGSSSISVPGFNNSGDFNQSCLQNGGGSVTINGRTACRYTIRRNYNYQFGPNQSLDLNALENGYGYGGGNYGGYGNGYGGVFDRVRIYDKVRVISSNGLRVILAGQDLGQVAADVTVQSNAEGTMIVSNASTSNGGFNFNWSWSLPTIRTVEVTRCLDSDLRTTYSNCP